MTTGLAPEVDAGTQKRFDHGHAVEALLRTQAEKMLGEPLYAFVGVPEDESSLFSASFDGCNFVGDTPIECKLLNARLRAAFADMETIAPEYRERSAAQSLPIDYRIQLEQQARIAEVERVLFMAGELRGDGTLGDTFSCWYYPDDALWARIVGGWKQLAVDLAAYEPVEVLDRPAPVGHRPDQLPALRSSVTGELVLESNIKEWEAAALTYIKSVRDHELKTDEDFANADAAAKWCDSSKTSLEGVRAQLMGATGDVNLAVGTLDRIMSELDKTRITFTNAIKANKESRKGEIVAGGIAALREHVAKLNERIGKPYMSAVVADFAGAIKGKSSLAKMKDAVSSELARCKTATNEIADKIDTNLRYLREHASAHISLFPDTDTIVLKAPEDLQTLVTARIAQHKLAEEAREAEIRERAFREAEARVAAQEIERQQQANREAAARQAEIDRQAAEAAKPVPTAAPVAVAAPAPISKPAAANSPSVVPMVARGKPTLRLGEINERIAPLAITEAGLQKLGFPAAARERSACMYHEVDFPSMVDSMVAQLRTAQHRQLEVA